MTPSHLRIIRGIGAVIAAGVLVAVVMNNLEAYQQEKRVQRAVSPTPESADEATQPTSTSDLLHPNVTGTGKGTSSAGTTKTAPPAKGSTVIILVDGVNMRTAPDTQSEVIRGLTRGEKFILLSTAEGFYQVQDERGNKGWVSSKPDFTKVTQ